MYLSRCGVFQGKIITLFETLSCSDEEHKYTNKAEGEVPHFKNYKGHDFFYINILNLLK